MCKGFSECFLERLTKGGLLDQQTKHGRVLKIRTIGMEALVSVAGGTLKTFKDPEQDATHYYHYFPLQLEKEKIIEYKHCKARV